MGKSIIQPEDYKYYVQTPDPSFSPQRNKAIIQETINETDKYFREIGKHIDANLGNRIDILSSYATYRFNRGEKTFKDYAGKRLVSELIGEKILSRVRVMESVNKINGNDRFKDFIML